MKIKFLDSAVTDLDWFGEYYESYFPEGKARGSQRFLSALDALASSPFIGRPSETEGLREFSIPNIPYLIVYRLKANEIEILRIWDTRAAKPELWI